MFARLGAFVGGFDLEAAQNVCVCSEIDDWAVLDCVAGLVDKSLVIVEGGDPPRHRLLESPRAFAVEQLNSTEDARIVFIQACGGNAPAPAVGAGCAVHGGGGSDHTACAR